MSASAEFRCTCGVEIKLTCQDDGYGTHLGKRLEHLIKQHLTVCLGRAPAQVDLKKLQ